MGQLGVGDSKDHFVPQLVKEITGYDIVEVATGKSHTLFLTSCGKVLAAGSNEQGQCGQGRKTGNLETPKLVVHDGAADIVSVACGAEFSVMLDKEGKVWTFGHPENGTLGHNDDGKFMQKANKVSNNDCDADSLKYPLLGRVQVRVQPPPGEGLGGEGYQG